MKNICSLTFILLGVLLITSCVSEKKMPSQNKPLFAKNNLVAWCIIPYDNQNRSPLERAQMLSELGITKMAYDWRAEHLPDFPKEIQALQQHNIDMVSAWLWIDANHSEGLGAEHDMIFDTIEEAGISTTFWIGMNENLYEGLPEEEKMEKVSGIISEVYRRAQVSGSDIALYNHGGWFSEPENQVKVIETLGYDDIGIVFNFHHGHKEIDRFEEVLDIMMPYLRTVNLNGMKKDGSHIVDIGKGDYERQMIKALKASGFQGDIGIIGHTEGEDVKQVLERNIDGLQVLLSDLNEVDALNTYDQTGYGGI